MGTQLDGIINKNYSKLNYLDFHILNFDNNILSPPHHTMYDFVK